MGFLDQVIQATEERQTIRVVENHNVRSIEIGTNAEDLRAGKQRAIADLRARQAGGDRGWDAAEMGMSLEAQIARLEAADTPEAIAEELEELTNRAIRRANLDVSNGRVNVLVAGGEMPWHRLGTYVNQAVNSLEAMRLSGLAGWRMRKDPLYRRNGRGELVVSKNRFSIVRGDTDVEMGTVGPRYEIIENEVGFSFLDKLLAEFKAEFATAGSVDEGRRVWMQVHLPAASFAFPGGDDNRAFAMFTNTHDGTAAAQCLTTSERAVCANTFRTAMNAKAKAFHMRHTGDIRGKVADARRALGLAVKSLEDYRDKAEVLIATPCPSIQTFAHGILDAVLDVTQAEALKGADALAAAILATDASRKEREAAVKQKERQIEERAEMFEDILIRYESRTNGVGGMRGSAWSAFNAITEHADHFKRGRQRKDEVERETVRFDAILTGDADEMKQVAYTSAIALAN